MWSAAIGGVEYDFAVERGESVQSMQTRLAKAGPAFALQVAGICEQERLDEMLICPGESVEVYSYGGMIAHVLTFAALRRTLVAGALHDAAFTDLDAGDPIRWLTEAT
jgi:hypothetical protein